jgi:hypothetical protein
MADLQTATKRNIEVFAMQAVIDAMTEPGGDL